MLHVSKMDSCTNICSKKKKEVLELYVILDRFHRDYLYKRIGIKLLFKDLADGFVSILNNFEDNYRLNAFELGFEDYGPCLWTPKDITVSGILNKHNPWKEGMKFSLLSFACSQSIPSDETERYSLERIIQSLIKACPLMIIQPLQLPDDGPRNGPTPLHLMVVKGTNSKEERRFKNKILRKMLKLLNRVEDKEANTINLSKFNLTGDWSNGLLFRGKTILNIAARTLDKITIKLLLAPIQKDKPAPVCFDSYNEFKDNIYHSLIRYTIYCPDKENQVISTMREIEEFLVTNCDTAIDESKKGRPERLWLMRNHEHLTPLQLAAKLGRIELFKFIMDRQVYRLNSGDMGSFDDDSYDITEIDTLPVEQTEENDNKTADREKAKEKKVRHISVIHLLEKNCSDETSVRFVNHKVMVKVIAEKWKYYQKWFILWTVIHLLMMCLFSWQAVVRSRLENPIPSQTATIPEYDNVAFVIASSCIICIYGLICIVMQRVYYFYCYYKNACCCSYRHTKHIPIWSYCLVFLFFGVCIILDFILMLILPSYDNFILPFVIIIGWYLSIYFLHVLERFSFFTVLIKQVVRHLIDFGVILSALLLGFSIAMFVVMQKADDIEEDTFENLEKTIVKMFTIMLGIGELGVLFNARHPVLAIIIFCLFVLLTTILLLNALIAIMSNTCSELTGGVTKKAYVRLQRMYTIIDLEAMLPRRLLRGCGEQVKRPSPINVEQVINVRLLSLRSEENENNEDEKIEGIDSKTILNQISSALFGRSKRTKPKRHKKTKIPEGAVAPTERVEHIDISENVIRLP